MDPLVSVSLPCFDSRRTLGRALASLLAQSHERWECLLVDDGSSDRPEEVVEQAADRRIRVFRLPENRGRGAARQLALDNSLGEFHCMLDADDWLYPDRLASQLEVFRAVPELDLVGAGAAVVDSENRLLGVRRCAAVAAGPVVRGPLTSPRPMAVVGHAFSMVRMAAARRAGYHRAYRRFEDKEFLLQVLLAGRHALLPRLLYAYREAERLDLAAVLASLRSARGVYQRHRRALGRAYLGALLSLAIKASLYRVAAALGLGGWLVRRRSPPPTDDERAAFEAARRTVDAIWRERFEDRGADAG